MALYTSNDCRKLHHVFVRCSTKLIVFHNASITADYSYLDDRNPMKSITFQVNLVPSIPVDRYSIVSAALLLEDLRTSRALSAHLR
jgi:hypothetical protein